MKKILKAFSWAVFFISVVFVAVAVLCCLGGVLFLVATAFSAYFANLFAYAAIGFFGSLAILLLIYLFVRIYYLIEKVAKK